MVCFYDYESDLGDGWEDAAVHDNPEEKRLQALLYGSQSDTICANQINEKAASDISKSRLNKPGIYFVYSSKSLTKFCQSSLLLVIVQNPE